MNIDLNSLLEYQKTDIQLRRLLDEIEKNEDYKKLEQAKNEFNAAKTMVNESEKAAENIIKFYESALNYYEENNKKIDEITNKLNTVEDDEERGHLISQLIALKDKFAELEKKLSDRRERSDKVIRAYLEAQDRGKKMREIYNGVKLRLDGFKKEKEPQIEGFKKQLSIMEKKIDIEILKQYKALTNERKYPAFVQVISDDKKNFRCFCGLTLSQKTKSELQDKGMCRCETCRRIIYNK